MDGNTTAGGVPLDPATASALRNVLGWALFACLIIGILMSMAIVINYIRGPKERLEQRRPTVVAAPPPAVDVELAQEPVLECTFRMADGWEETNRTCSVCLSEMADGEGVRVLMACKHCFHTTCVEQWLREHATCPLCRGATGAAAAKHRQHRPTT